MKRNLVNFTRGSQLLGHFSFMFAAGLKGPLRDCQDFRVWAGIMGKKETHYVPTQGAVDSG